MSAVVIAGDTSGSVTLNAPAVAGTTTLTLPTTSGTVLTTTSGQWITTGSNIYYNTGNVGIGVTSPSEKLDIAATSNPRIRFEDTGDFEWRIGIIDNNHFGFFSSGSVTERMRIQNGGELLVGVTTYSFTSTNYGIAFQPGGESLFIANTPGNLMALNRNNDGLMFKFFRSGAQVGTISVTSTNTTYGTSSDYRLKENVAPMVGALDKVAQLKPVTYKWKIDGSDGEGFIAHELGEVMPNAVIGEKDAVDEDGNIKPQGIDTSFLVATLTAAIQELKEELDTVKSELATLKGAA
jgi:hypothetical protein